MRPREWIVMQGGWKKQVAEAAQRETSAEATLRRLHQRLSALADGWEHGDSMVMRVRYAKPSDYAAALREAVGDMSKSSTRGSKP